MDFKICVIGCGSIARSQHGPACKHYEYLHKGTQFAACCDIDEERAKSFKEDFGLSAWYTDMNTMLEMENPQAVCLISPVEKTAELSIKILEKGFPLILEKPPGMNIEETRQMIHVAETHAVPNLVAFNRRYMPIILKAMDLLEEWGGADCITDVNYRMVRANRRDENFASTAIHGIDLVSHIVQSDYQQIDFRYKNLPQYGETVANFHLAGEMENGVAVNLDFWPMSGVNTERIEINTHRGLLSINLPIWAGCYDGFGKLTHFVDSKEALVLNGEDIAESDDEFVLGGFYHENAIFFDAVKNRSKIKGDIASGLQAVEIADIIRQRQAKY